MRVTREQAAANRDKILEVAGTLLRGAASTGSHDLRWVRLSDAAASRPAPSIRTARIRTNGGVNSGF